MNEAKMDEETHSSWWNFCLASVGAFDSKVTTILQVEFVRRLEGFEKILSFFYHYFAVSSIFTMINFVNGCHWQIKLVGSLCKLDSMYINEKSPKLVAMSALLTSFPHLLLGSTGLIRIISAQI